MAEDEPFGEPACRLRGRALLVVQQPLVGVERAVEPHRVVEARDHEAVVVPRVRVRHHRGVEQREVRRVRDDARVQQRVVGQLAVGADPHVLLGLASIGTGIEPARQLGRALIDRPLAPDPLDEVGREPVGVRLESLPERRQRLGIGRVRHRVLVLGTGLVDVERRRQIEDRPAVLDRDDAPGREAAAVADAVDLVDDRDRGSPGRRKYACSECTSPRSTVRPAAIERLPRDLAAEHPLAVLVGAQPAEEVDLELFELQQVDQVVERRAHAG